MLFRSVHQPAPSKKWKKKAITSADLSWVGHVVDRPDGYVKVMWGDGSMSNVRVHMVVSYVISSFSEDLRLVASRC